MGPVLDIRPGRVAPSFGAEMAELCHRLVAVQLLTALGIQGAPGDAPELLSLALFTPNAQFNPSVVSVSGRRVEGGVEIDGRVRTGHGAARGSLVPIRIGPAVRLCLVDHEAAGARIQGMAGAAPAWLHLEGCFVSEARTSGPLSWPDDSRVARVLDGLGPAVARLAAEACGAGLRELRRVLASTECAGGVASQSQLVAHEISKFEIEVWLLGAAAVTPPADPWPLLCGALETIRTFVALTEDLDVEIGLDWSSVPGPWPTRADLGHLGGVRTVQGEDARRAGLHAAGAGR